MSIQGMDIDPALLRRTRQLAGLSLQDVVRGSAFTRQAAHLAETGKTRPSYGLLKVMARNLDRKPKDFVRPISARAATICPLCGVSSEQPAPSCFSEDYHVQAVVS